MFNFKYINAELTQIKMIKIFQNNSPGNNLLLIDYGEIEIWKV